ncbi:MAG TPA: ATP-binding cassette domain-containing protein [Microbacteriaceae bacterium]|nr:ATP-binding cassette domain-containing protein [Microbacteriaceae bacterium]
MSDVTTSARLAMRAAVEGGRIAAHEPTPNQLVNAVLTCAEAERITVPKTRIAPTLRARPANPERAIRALGLAARKIDLSRDPNWFRASTEALVVNYAGEWLAVTAHGTHAKLHPTAGRPIRVTAEVASRIDAEAWALIPSLQDGATTMWALARLGWARGSLRDIATMVALTLVSIVVGMVNPILSGLIIGELVPAKEASSIAVLTVILVLVSAGAIVLSTIQGMVITRFAQRFGLRLTEAVYERVFRLPASFHRENVPGELGDRIGGVGAFQSIVGGSIPALIGAFGMLVGGISVMSSLSPTLAIAVIGLAIVSLLIGAALLPRLFASAKLQTETGIELSGLTFSMLMGVAKIRTAGAEGRMFARWGYRFARMHFAMRELSQTNLILGIVSGLPSSLVPIMLVTTVSSGLTSLSIGEFTTATSAAAQAAAAITGFLPLIISIVSTWPRLTAIKPVLDAVPESLGDAGGDPGELSGKLAFENVTFGYDPDQPVLKDVSFSVQPGSMTAIVGASGSGKSTIIRLLLGLEVPDSGTVLFDGQALSSLDRSAVVEQMGVVPQESALIPGTIQDNILASAPGLGEREAWIAAQRAGVAQDIIEMPMGMQTVVSDGAGSFSGGQKQRLMIARALAREPRLLILDEATSALDNRTQQMVSESVSQIGATRIVVAHRLSTIRDADQIIVLDKGVVAEVGTYEELMALGGLFHRLASRQIA